MNAQKLCDNITAVCHEGYAQKTVLVKTQSGTYGIKNVELTGETYEFINGVKTIVDDKKVVIII